MTIHILGGGTLSHIRGHLALAAPAYGGTAFKIDYLLYEKLGHDIHDNEVRLHLTRMANPSDHRAAVTNDDVAVLVDGLIADPETRVIYFNVALCDFDGEINRIESGKYATRLKTSEGAQKIDITPSPKLIGRIRKERKDIFLIGFKTTAGATSDEQYIAGLNLLKANSVNLVLANDIVTRNNMIIAPEENRYCETTDRDLVLRTLVDMVEARRTNTFTRSTVVKGSPVDFQNDARVPDNLRKVVNHLVERNAYKVFRGSTAGHFAARLRENACLTSRRKTNYNEPHGLDLVEVEYDGFDKVIAYGAKPSVGGQSQRIIFDEHPDLDCIVHAHAPLRDNAPDAIPVVSQFPNECGSRACGENTSRNLGAFGGLKAVMLDNHGPNICFSRETNPEVVIDFIERNFDLEAKTGGLVS